MRVFTWGSGLAVRLPATVVEALKLKEGDEVEVGVAGERLLHIGSPDAALERFRALRKPLPADWKFDRDDANAR